MKINLYIFITVIMLSCLLPAQHIVFEHLTRKDGLSQNTIQSIIQDRQGFLWFGTQDGLDKYDGYNFKTCREKNTVKGKLSDNFVTVLLEDREGYIWIGTNAGGLNRLDPRTDSILTFMSSNSMGGSIAGNNILSLCEDSHGNIWVGTLGEGVSVFNPQTGTFQNFLKKSTESQRTVLALYADSTGNVWAGTESGTLYKMRLDQSGMMHIESFYLKPGNDREQVQPITAITCLHDSLLLIGTRGYGLYDFATPTGSFNRSHLERLNGLSHLKHVRINFLYHESENQLWMGTDNHGLFQVNLSTHQITIHEKNDCWDGSLSSNQVLCMARDKSGIIWIGTRDKGIDKYDPRRNQFKLYTPLPNRKNSLGYHIIRCFYNSEPDQLWIGTFGGGLDKLDRKNEKFYHYRHDPTHASTISGNNISAIWGDGNKTVWIGTWGEGLNWMRNGKVVKKFRWVEHDSLSLSDNRVQVIYRDLQNHIWIGTEQGLNLYLPESGKFRRFLHDPNDPSTIGDNRIQSNCLQMDRYHDFWIGTWGGLNRATIGDHGRLQVREQYSAAKEAVIQIPDSRIISLLIEQVSDSVQNIWAGTYGSGLLRIRLKRSLLGKILKRTLRVYDVTDGLPSNIIYGILKDKNNHLWMSTNQGLCRLGRDHSGKTEIDVFGTSYGLQSTQFFWGAVHQNERGEMFFGGINGFNVFTPEDITVNKFQPPVVITEFRVNNEKLIEREAFEFKKYYEVDYEKNVISIAFAALDFTMPDLNRYEYRLDGFDKEWIQAGFRHEVTYTHLDPGEYQFHVRGTNSGGKWSREEAHISIRIIPPWYMTIYFRFGLFFVIIGSVISIFYWKIRTKDKHNRELQQHNQELNNKLDEIKRLQQQVIQMQKMESIGTLAGGVAHDFNNILTVINGHAELALIKSDPEKIKKDLQTILENGERAAALTNQLLAFSRKQIIQPHPLNLNRVIENMKQMMARLIGEDIVIETILGAELKLINADTSQIEQILMNLVVNARDAIYQSGKNGTGGKITITTVNKTLNTNRAKKLQDIIPGDYVMLQVSDTGIGMTKEIQEKIFDPFFTTKGVGQGTGLGLSTVYGIVRQNDGWITVESTPGEQTTFTIYWPALAGNQVEEMFLTQPGVKNIKGNERILIVEDDENVRSYSREVLTELGYEVDVVEAPDEVIRILENNDKHYHLVITDIIMPGMNGRILAEKVLKINPQLNVLLMSGNANSNDNKITGLQERTYFIQKPFSMDEIGRKVREILDK